MKGLAIVSRGIEESASVEIRELTNAVCKIDEGCVIFDFKDFGDLCLLCYKAQSVDRVLCMMGSFQFENFFEDFEKFIAGLDFEEWLNDHRIFRVECMRIGTHNFNSVNVEIKSAKFILQNLKKKNIDKNIAFGIKDCEMIFFVYIINNKCYFGIDFAGFELNKRSYKIFLHPNSLRGTIAYALVKEGGFEKNGVVLDPFSKDGVISIEAAFYASGFPHNYYKKDRFAFLKLKLGIEFEKFFSKIDKSIKKAKAEIYSFDNLFKCVDYSKKNAKIAGVDKLINFSRVELEWLDIRFKERSVDVIVSNPPASKNANLDKIYNEFFYQSAYILNNKGVIALISRIPEFVKKHAEKHEFVVGKEKDVWSGEQSLKIIVLRRK
ncbi:methyltransferase [Candidatus Woesearchaeota archaeon]|nr:methyltransferase [Candidatus Woesearchaeota archaeon]